MPGDPSLLDAILGMKGEVTKLNAQLKDYAKKADIKRTYQLFAVAVTLGLVASFLITIFTVSGCFLSRSAISGNAPAACSVMPGYKLALQRAKVSQKRQVALLKDIERNKKINKHQTTEIKKLKARLGVQ